MNTRRQPRMRGKSAQLLDEVRPLGLVERCEDLVLDGLGLGFGFGEGPASAFGQMHRMGAPIGGMSSAAHQSAFFQFVDEPDHGVAVHVQQIGELLLTAPVDGHQVGEDSEVRGFEPQRCEPRGEQVRDVVADLGQQEDAPVVQRLIRHTSTVASARYCHLR